MTGERGLSGDIININININMCDWPVGVRLENKFTLKY